MGFIYVYKFLIFCCIVFPFFRYLSNAEYLTCRDLVSVNPQWCAMWHYSLIVKYGNCSKHGTEYKCMDVSCKKKSVKSRIRLEDLDTDTRMILNVCLLCDMGRCWLDSCAENRDQWLAVWNDVMSLYLNKWHPLRGVKSVSLSLLIRKWVNNYPHYRYKLYLNKNMKLIIT